MPDKSPSARFRCLLSSPRNSPPIAFRIEPEKNLLQVFDKFFASLAAVWILKNLVSTILQGYPQCFVRQVVAQSRWQQVLPYPFPRAGFADCNNDENLSIPWAAEPVTGFDLHTVALRSCRRRENDEVGGTIQPVVELSFEAGTSRQA
jgi:hypothetical protein